MGRPTNHPTKVNPILRAEGWDVIETVQRWVPKGMFGERRDMYGFADAVALHERGTGELAIQYCSQSAAAEHIRKLTDNPLLVRWLRAAPGYHHCEIWSGRKRKLKRGSKAVRWWYRRYRARLRFDDPAGPTTVPTEYLDGMKGHAEVVFEEVDDIGPDHPLWRKAKDYRKKNG